MSNQNFIAVNLNPVNHLRSLSAVADRLLVHYIFGSNNASYQITVKRAEVWKDQATLVSYS